jgi:DNA-binding CsgD family transcriptional regulator
MRDGQSAKSVSRVGILLLNAQLRPVHYNAEAAHILLYPKKTRAISSIDALLPTSRFQLAGLTEPAIPMVLAFTSGRRRYLCRAFQLDESGSADRRFQPRVLLVLERERKNRADTTRWSEQFQLTSRECETVKLLLKGLTSKEIATEMSISPNTVKSFLKLAMAKVGASNRTALIARILEKASILLLVLLPLDFLL